MATKLCSTLRSTILIGSVLLVSACASVRSGETAAGMKDETTPAVLEGNMETPPAVNVEPHVTSPAPTSETPAPGTLTSPDTDQAPDATVTRINGKEPLVNVRRSPTTKSRVLAVLKTGYAIKVLEEKDGWLNIQWSKAGTVKKGWLKKVFVEGYEK